MNKDGPTNEPVIDRPPVNADLAPVPEEIAPPTVDAEGTPQTRIGRFKLPTATLRAYTMLVALVVIWLFLQWATVSDLHPYGLFLDPVNFSKLLKQTAVTGILAVGMLMVIVAGQIDLSVGSLVGLAGGMAAMTQGWGLIPSLGTAIVIGLAIGLIHGSLVAYLNIPAFIVTLGGLLAWRGVVLWRMKGVTVTIELPAFRSIGEGFVAPVAGIALGVLAVAALIFFTFRRNSARRRHGLPVPGMGATLARILLPAAVIAVFIYMMNTQGGVPIPVFVFLAVALIGAFLTQNTTFGRYLYAVGGNPDAARLSGISLRKHILLAFCLMGTLAGLGALVYTARNGSAAGDAGSLMELDAIAACVIGGTSLMGGRGTVFGACLGALIMASLDNGMSLLNVQNEIQMIVKGAVLVAAVGFDMLGRKRG
ncbi:MAG: D-xylose transport system permease protein [Acidobacteriota bacterium]|jgi:D-xylose transport system permease protein|nr:D-xylose transport system permease protein [Acidobacteriota bacterium]